MAELARRVSPPTTDSQINKLEKSIVQMTIAWVYKLADALEVHPLDLIEPLAKLSEPEQKVIRLFRGLSDERKERIAQDLEDFARLEGATPRRKAS